jgi:secreted trypsin-like serine protease
MTWLLRVLVAVLVLAVPVPAFAATTPAIVGGTPVDIADAPWMVALIDQHGHPFCDGVLTAPNTVLTAAHCLAGRTADSILVLGGRSDLGVVTDGDSVSGVSAIDVEPGYVAAQRGADLAGLTLATAFTYRPLPVVTGTSVYRAGVMGTVLGWGRPAQTGPTTSALHEIHVPLVAATTCQRLYDGVVSGSSYDPAAMFCAGYVMPAGQTGPDACQGDAGGPLVIDGRLAGIVSWGVGCGRYPSFYTKVGTYVR